MDYVRHRSEHSAADGPVPGKRGAPGGHPGWFRATPTAWDQTVDVAAPNTCPHCGGNPRVPPTNNLAERALRPLVVLRKITFGHRTSAGAKRMAWMMTVQETAERHGHKATHIFYRLLTQPPNRVLKYLYAGGK